MSVVRVTMIGFGWVAQNVWFPLLLEAGIEPVSVIDPSPEARAALKTLLPSCRAHDTLDGDALKGANLAIVCSPNIHHVDHAAFAMLKGLHVTIEKPGCFTLLDADRLINLSQHLKRGLWITSASSHRSDVRCLLEQVRKGSLGSISCVEVGWRRRAGIPRPGSWFTRAESAVAGSGCDLGWHVLEIGLALLDYPMIKSGFSSQVGARGDEDQFAATWRNDKFVCSSRELSVDIQLYGSLMTEVGTVVQVSTAWASHQPCDKTFVRAYGEMGELALYSTFGFSTNTVKSPRVTLTRHGDRVMLAYPSEEKIAPYRGFIRQLLERAERAETSGKDIAADYFQLRSLASAMSALYPKVTHSVATEDAMRWRGVASCE